VRLTSDATGQDIEVVGRTTSRPPFSAEKFGVLAGRSFEPVRLTAMHHRHVELGAQMMPAGLWMRPAYYGPKADRATSIEAEALNVRENVGIIDVSTLGGLEIRGADAAEFMNRMYTFAYLKQPVGRSRYVLMTDDTGVIMDDGVACRFAENHFYVTATTGGVDNVYRQMLWRNAQWRLDVDVTNVTAAYAGVNIAGPRSRDVLAKLCDDVDLTPDGFPYMGIREGTVAGIPARLLRVGFVGELGYEIWCHPKDAKTVFDAVWEAGRPHGLKPLGLDALDMLRIEAGLIFYEYEFSDQTDPFEAGIGFTVPLKSKEDDFIGREALIRRKEHPQKKLVGLEIDGNDAVSHGDCVHVGRAQIGEITSSTRSPILKKNIALARIDVTHADDGTEVEVGKLDGHQKRLPAVIVPFPHYDPTKSRVRA